MIKTTKKYKLHCFHCGNTIPNKEEVCRAENGFPICGNCLFDQCQDWEDDETIYEIVKRDFNGNYKKFMKDLKENYQICQKCDKWMPKKDFIDLECSECLDEKSYNKFVLPNKNKEQLKIKK